MRPEWDAAAPRGDQLLISKFRIPLDIDFVSTREVRLVGHPASVRRHCRVIVAEVAFHQRLHVEGALDCNLPDRALRASWHLGKQESAVCRPATGAQTDEILATREEPLVAAAAIRRPPEQLWVTR